MAQRGSHRISNFGASMYYLATWALWVGNCLGLARYQIDAHSEWASVQRDEVGNVVFVGVHGGFFEYITHISPTLNPKTLNPKTLNP